MIDNRYPLFLYDLMQENSFGKVAFGYRHPNPDEWVSGPVGFAIDRCDKKINPNNPFFSKLKEFADKNGVDIEFFENDDITHKSRVLKK